MLQTVRTLRAGTTAGVSRLSWMVMGANSGFWLCYGVKTHSVQQIIGNAPWLVMVLIVGHYLAEEHRVSRVLGAAWPVLMLLAGTTAMMVSEMLMAPIGVVFNVLIGVPQLREIKRAGSAAGVSVWAWLAVSLGSACWLVYGIGMADVPVILAAATGSAIQLSVAVLVSKRVWGVRSARYTG